MKKRSTTEKIVSLIFNIGRAFKKQYSGDDKGKSRLSMLQTEALLFIGEGKEVLMKDLAGHLFVAPPSATSLVDELVKAKLVARSESKEDRRIIVVSLTKKGKRVLAVFLKRKMEKVEKLIARLTRSEKKGLLRILEKLASENN